MRVIKAWLILYVFSGHLVLLAQESNNSSPVFQESNLSQFPKEVPARSTIMALSTKLQKR